MKFRRIVASAMVMAMLGGMFMMTGCSSDSKKDEETKDQVTSETTEETTAEETTEETTESIWSPDSANLYSEDSLEEQVKELLFDPETLTNETLKSYATGFQNEGLDLIKLNMDHDKDVKNVVYVEEGFKASNYYAQFTGSSSLEDTDSIISAFAVSFAEQEKALEFFNDSVTEYQVKFPDATLDQTELGLVFSYSNGNDTVWIEYNEAAKVVAMYENYKLF